MWLLSYNLGETQTEVMVMDERKEEILAALRRVKDPDLGRDIVSLGFVKEVKVCGATASFTIELTTPACPVREQMKEEARRAALTVPGIQEAQVTMTAQVRATRSEQKEQLIPSVKNIVPIASGKGGVGKSTVSANLAVALHKMGARVGLMDADVYGPSIPTIMGVKGQPTRGGDGKLIPPSEHGIGIISMGFFMPPGEAAIWRGPMLHKTVEQFLGAVTWGDLDYLIVDLPPGTGDVQLSLCQLIPLTGAAVVSTPQDVALKVAEKAILMFRKLRTPVLGLIENMSGFECSHCGQREDVFGSGGARRYGMEAGIPFLGEIPLATDVRIASDEGQPIVLSKPDSPAAKAFVRIAENLAAQISVRIEGGGEDGRPEPVAITRPSKNSIQIRWKDGHESSYTGQQLRRGCSCAQCVDEVSGRAVLNPETIGPDVHALAFNPVGRYALHFEWSDGHRSGIYTYEHLRKLCPCGECAAEVVRAR
jgi:ATP-binding protein involved in chromosome partitioning